MNVSFDTVKIGHFKVKIACWREHPKKGAAQPQRIVRRFIVAAKDSDSAIKIAKDHAETTATMFGPRWMAFEHMETFGPIKFPVELP